MTKEVTVTLYTIDELDPAIRDKVIDKNRHVWGELENYLLDEQFNEVLEYLGFTDMRLGYSLGYSQGDGVAFYGKLDLDLIAGVTEEKLNDWPALKVFQPYITDVKLAMDKLKGEYLEADISSNNHYHHYNTMSVIVDSPDNNLLTDESMLNANIGNLERELASYIKKLSRYLERLGYDMIEHESSNETIIERMRDNEVMFTEDGRIFTE